MKLNSLVVGLVLVGLGSWAWLNQQGPEDSGLARADLSNPTRDLLEWQVVKVTDGDTIKVRRDGEEMTLRLCGIDAPEKKQELGLEATETLRSLVTESGGWVMVNPVETDRYGRTVAEVWSDSVGLLNGAMVGAGMAYVYERYVDGCPTAEAMRLVERDAREYGLGVWGRSDSVKPWDWRKARR